MVYKLIRILTYPFHSLYLWSEAQIERSRRRRLARLFPDGCKVRALDSCPCGQRHAGLTGTVRYMVDDYDEWRVEFRNGVSDLLCSKGMEKVK